MFWTDASGVPKSSEPPDTIVQTVYGVKNLDPAKIRTWTNLHCINVDPMTDEICDALLSCPKLELVLLQSLDKPITPKFIELVKRIKALVISVQHLHVDRLIGIEESTTLEILSIYADYEFYALDELKLPASMRSFDINSKWSYKMSNKFAFQFLHRMNVRKGSFYNLQEMVRLHSYIALLAICPHVVHLFQTRRIVRLLKKAY